MNKLLHQLKNTYGTHKKVAAALGYTTRHYQRIRKVVDAGGHLSAHVEDIIKYRSQELGIAEDGKRGN